LSLKRLVLVLSLLPAMLSLGSCQLFKPKTPDMGGGGFGGGIPPAAIKAWFVETRMWAPAIDLVGDIRPRKRTFITAEVAGRVTSISSREGEVHLPGSGPLITIDDTQYRAQFKSAQAEVSAARERLNELESGARSEEILSMEAQVESARANRDKAAADLNRARRLFSEGVFSQSQLDNAIAQADATAGTLESLQEQLKKLREGERYEVIAAARANLEAREAQLDSARNNLERCRADLSFPAMVSKLMVEEGQYVNPGTQLAEVISSEGLEAWFDLPEYALEYAASGSPVEIRSATIPDEVISGQVIQVVYDADPTSRQFPVRVSVNDDRLKPGYFVTGRLLTAEPQPTTVVPEDALQITNLGEVVYRLKGIMDFLDAARKMADGQGGEQQSEGSEGASQGGPPGGGGGGGMAALMDVLPTAEQVLVETGLHLDGMVAIESSQAQGADLKPGDWIVTLGNETLFPSRPCIPTNAEKAGKAFGQFMAQMSGGQPSGTPPKMSGSPPVEESDQIPERMEGSNGD
jgi:multidrug efflux pump subunit AcrA (membrane-fusion protein)